MVISSSSVEPGALGAIVVGSPTDQSVALLRRHASTRLEIHARLAFEPSLDAVPTHSGSLKLRGARPALVFTDAEHAYDSSHLGAPHNVVLSKTPMKSELVVEKGQLFLGNTTDVLRLCKQDSELPAQRVPFIPPLHIAKSIVSHSSVTSLAFHSNTSVIHFVDDSGSNPVALVFRRHTDEVTITVHGGRLLQDGVDLRDCLSPPTIFKDHAQ